METTNNYVIKYSELNDFINAVETRVKSGSNLLTAMKDAGNYLVTVWIRNAGKSFKHSQGEYVQGIIEGIEYPYEGDELHFVVINQDPKAAMLENGTKPFDMKKVLYTSEKVRISKDGKRYLIIPFEHGNPDAVSKNPMPKEIYRQAAKLAPSTITGHRMEGSQRTATSYEEAQLMKNNLIGTYRYEPMGIPSAESGNDIHDMYNHQLSYELPQVRRLTYKWGNSLQTDDPKYQGMYKFNRNPETARQEIVRETGVGKFTYVNATGNNRAYSNYITFRVMSEDSEGWKHPGISAMYILKHTVEEVENPIRMMIAEAIKKDLSALFSGM